MHDERKPSGEVRGEAFGDGSPEARWVTYDELSQIRGIGRESAVKLVQRKGWRRVRGNDGEARVFVPQDWLTLAKSPEEDIPGDNPPDIPPSIPQDNPRLVHALEAAIVNLTVRAERAEAEADRAIAALQAERDRVERAEARAEEERQRATEALSLLRQAADRLEDERSNRTAAEADAVRSREEAAARHAQATAAEAEAAAAQTAKQEAKGWAEAAERDRKAAQAEVLRLREAVAERQRANLWARLRRAWRGE